MTWIPDDDLARLYAVIEAHLGEEAFSVARLAAALNLSRVQLHRRVCRATGVSPGQLISRRRLERAAVLLRQGVPVTEVVYAVGLQNLSHFAKVFRRHYGMVPAAYAARATSGARPKMVLVL